MRTELGRYCSSSLPASCTVDSTSETCGGKSKTPVFTLQIVAISSKVRLYVCLAPWSILIHMWFHSFSILSSAGSCSTDTSVNSAFAHSIALQPGARIPSHASLSLDTGWRERQHHPPNPAFWLVSVFLLQRTDRFEKALNGGVPLFG